MGVGNILLKENLCGEEKAPCDKSIKRKRRERNGIFDRQDSDHYGCRQGNA